MAIYAYCMLRLTTDESWPVMDGIGGHPVFPFRSGKYTMLLSRLNRNFSFSPRSIVEHGQVIARAFETHTVLPMRFGTFFSSEKQIEQLVRENQRDLLETFCRLRGKSEMRLKLSFPSVAGDGASPKKQPQKARSLRDSGSNGEMESEDPRNREMAEQMASWLREMFHPLADQVSCRRLHSHELVVDCAHLIESQRVEAYRQLSCVASGQVKDCAMR
ncbi:MAG: GvpL/GvpF family gas vesicle protein, partial [Terriglobia bacterium]